MAILGFLSRLFSPARARSAPESCLDVVAGWLGIARLGRSPPGTSGLRRHRRWALGRQFLVEFAEQTLTAETVDISAAGAGLLMGTSLPVGARVRLRDLDGRTSVPAQVVHVAPSHDQGHYRVGVQFILRETDVVKPAAGRAPDSRSASLHPAAQPPTCPAPTAGPMPGRLPSPAAAPAKAEVVRPAAAVPTAEETAATSTPAEPPEPSRTVAPTPRNTVAPAVPTPPPAPSPDHVNIEVETEGPPLAAATATAQHPAATPGTAQSAEPPYPPWWIPRGTPVLSPPASPSAPPLQRELIEFVERAIQHAELNLPTLPHVVQRAVVLAQNEDVDFNRLAQLLEEDAALTASILRRANSAESAPVGRITRLNDALARLGQRRVLSTIAGAAVKRVTLETTGLDPERALQIWHTSVAAAAVMYVAAQRFGLRADEAALVGLLHDLGILAALRIAQLYRESYDPSLSAEPVQRLCAEWHEPLGCVLTLAWKFEPPLPELCGNHHSPRAPDDELARYRYLVQFADVVCALLEYAPYVPYDFFHVPCVRALGITDEPQWHAWLATLPAAVAERTGDLQ